MPIQEALSIVGLAKQAAKGTPTAEPTFVVGMRDGAAFKVDIDQELEELTLDGARMASNANRLTVVPGQAYSLRAHPKPIGLYLYGALGAISTTGTGPYTHVITPGVALPYLTAWGKFAGVLQRVQDAKIDELSFEWDKAGPVGVAVALLGGLLGFPASITPGTDASQTNYFRAAGGTFKFDAPSGTAVTAPITGGKVTIANGVEPVILSASVVPDDVFEAGIVIGCELKLTPANLDDWRETVTGSAAGTTASEVVVDGAFEVKFILDANTSLMFASTSAAWMIDFPDADPSGGAAEITAVGELFIPVDGAAAAAFTATLVNDVASY